MSEDRKVRVKERLRLLEGQDAASRIRGMGVELTATLAEGRRRAEVDGPERVTNILKVDVLVFETKDGLWRVETLTEADLFPGQMGKIEVVDRNERLAICEFRFALAHELVKSRFCRQPEALRAAGLAQINVQGRIPFMRIVSGPSVVGSREYS